MRKLDDESKAAFLKLKEYCNKNRRYDESGNLDCKSCPFLDVDFSNGDFFCGLTDSIEFTPEDWELVENEA